MIRLSSHKLLIMSIHHCVLSWIEMMSFSLELEFSPFLSSIALWIWVVKYGKMFSKKGFTGSA